MRRILWVISLSFLSLFGEEIPLSLESDHIDYLGDDLQLCGKVLLENEFGKIHANRAFLLVDKTPGQKKNFQHIKLEDQVCIEFAEGGKLDCQAAQLNLHTLEADFLKGKSSYVSYVEQRSYEEKAFPIEIRASQMQVKLTRQKELLLNQLQALGDVQISFGPELTVFGDMGIYLKADQSPEQVQKTGKVILSANSGQTCVVKAGEDYLYAPQIVLDIEKKQLVLIKPSGKLTRTDKNPAVLEFHCGRLIWDEGQSLLTLLEQVNISQAGIGELYNPHQVQIQLAQKEQKRQFQRLFCEGETRLVYRDAAKQAHSVITQGTFLIDQDKLMVLLERSQPDSENEGDQVFFEDQRGEILADRIQLHYAQEEDKLVLQQCALNGNVALKNRTAAGPEDLGEFFQFALAETVEFFPKTQEMILRAKPKKRVLFVDRLKNLQMSATALKIKRDQQTEQDSIQGVGNVRFNLIEHELEMLKKRFLLQKEENFNG